MIKNIFRANVINNIIALVSCVVTFVFGFNQYNKMNELDVKPIIKNKVIDKDIVDNLLFTTDDTIHLSHASFIPSFKNKSKYSINNLHVEYRLIRKASPLWEKYDTIFKFSYSNPYEFNNIKLRQFEYRRKQKYFVHTYSANIHSLYPNESLPGFIDNITLFPLGESISKAFTLEINLSWDGKKVKQFLSNYTIVKIKPKGKECSLFDDSLANSQNIKLDWLEQTEDFYKSVMEATDNVFWIYSEGNPDNYSLYSYYNIDTTNIASACQLNPDDSFRFSHDYDFEEPDYFFIEQNGVVNIMGLCFSAALVASLLLLIIDLIFLRHINFDRIILTIAYFILSGGSLSRWLISVKWISPVVYNYSLIMAALSLFILPGFILFQVIWLIRTINNKEDLEDLIDVEEKEKIKMPILKICLISLFIIIFIIFEFASYDNLIYINNHQLYYYIW